MTQNPSVSTVAELVSAQARRRADKTAFTFLGDGENEARAVTYAQLDQEARELARHVSDVAAPGDRALILANDSDVFVRSFVACQYAGVVAVPACPPVPISSKQRVQTLRSIARDSGAALVMTGGFSTMRDVLSDPAPEVAALPWLYPDDLGEAPGSEFTPVAATPDDLSFLQYTSGSTSSPKGVMVPHRSLLANEEMFMTCMSLGPDDVIVSWVPLYHDMGLIGTVLQSIYLGAHCVLMPPLTFVQRPERWLQAITRYGATMSVAPNFGYELCVERIPEATRAELDLSSWRVALNGAEPIRASTLDRFAATFAEAGFRSVSHHAGYGLAEATLIATGGEVTKEPTVLYVDAEALADGRLVEGGDKPIVGVGAPRLHRRVEIVEPVGGEALGEGRVGEVWLAGDDIAVGYWQRPEESEATFAARLPGRDERFLRTGDLGLLVGGELFISGRLKDLIIVDGHNHYPQDIEYTVETSHEWFRTGGCAAFTRDRPGHEEELVVVIEVKRPAGTKRADGAPDPEALTRLVRATVSEAHGVAVDDVAFVTPGAVPKTSSGKVKRSACREQYERDELSPARLQTAGAAAGGTG